MTTQLLEEARRKVVVELEGLEVPLDRGQALLGQGALAPELVELRGEARQALALVATEPLHLLGMQPELGLLRAQLEPGLGQLHGEPAGLELLPGPARGREVLLELGELAAPPEQALVLLLQLLHLTPGLLQVLRGRLEPTGRGTALEQAPLRVDEVEARRQHPAQVGSQGLVVLGAQRLAEVVDGEAEGAAVHALGEDRRRLAPRLPARLQPLQPVAGPDVPTDLPAPLDLAMEVGGVPEQRGKTTAEAGLAAAVGAEDDIEARREVVKPESVPQARRTPQVELAEPHASTSSRAGATSPPCSSS